MKKTFAIACLLVAAAFVACGCAKESRQPAPALEPLTMAPQTQAPTAEPATGEPGGEEPDDVPKPMKIECAVPDGFELSEDDSSDVASVYLSDVATIQYGYEETTDETFTPDGFRTEILGRLPEEAEEGSFQLISCDEAAFESYPGFVIKWTTGANEDTVAHEAHFILTDGFIYRVEYAVSADSADAEAARMKAFFDSVHLKDSAS
jgi:hypothetical protein